MHVTVPILYLLYSLFRRAVITGANRTVEIPCALSFAFVPFKIFVHSFPERIRANACISDPVVPSILIPMDSCVSRPNGSSSPYRFWYGVDITSFSGRIRT